MNDELLTELYGIATSGEMKDVWDREKKKREAYRKFEAQWEALIAKYTPYAKEYENRPADVVPDYIYNDLHGFLTVGTGHLLGFDWSDVFWDNRTVSATVERLKKEIRERQLNTNPGFNDFNPPQKIESWLKVTEDEYRKIFASVPVASALLEARSLPFKLKGQDVSDTELTQAFVILIGLAIMLSARQDVLGRSGHNPFIASPFKGVPGNELTLDSTTTDSLLRHDILRKIVELKGYLDRGDVRCDLSSLPVSAQLALLDINYTGSIDDVGLMKRLACGGDWAALKTLGFISPARKGSAYNKRNAQVERWFTQAEAEQKKPVGLGR